LGIAGIRLGQWCSRRGLFGREFASPDALLSKVLIQIKGPPPRRFRRTGDGPRESPAMYIYGSSQIHTAQPIAAPHRLTPTQNTGGYAASGVDSVDISPEADFVAQARDLPVIREDRVAAIRAQIQNGSYETADKLDTALSRLLDEIA
jgi:anti-sigma28 factor (negative regulator of flagellin synthesis)